MKSLAYFLICWITCIYSLVKMGHGIWTSLRIITPCTFDKRASKELDEEAHSSRESPGTLSELDSSDKDITFGLCDHEKVKEYENQEIHPFPLDKLIVLSLILTKK